MVSRQGASRKKTAIGVMSVERVASWVSRVLVWTKRAMILPRLQKTEVWKRFL